MPSHSWERLSECFIATVLFVDGPRRRCLALLWPAALPWHHPYPQTSCSVLVGCGRSDLYRVKGRVQFPDGTPLSKGRVVVELGGTAGQAWGRVKPDGSFTIGTLKENDGMKAGVVRVAIKDAEVLPNPNDPQDRGRQLVHRRFADPATSGLSFRVPEQTDWKIIVEKPSNRPARGL